MINLNPIISVIIPAYNHPEYLRNSIQSVINQSFKDFEIIVIDDGSEKDLKFIIQSFVDERIYYFKQKHSNANIARNFGIQKSRGKYIAMLDSGDLWQNNHLKECVHTIETQQVEGLYGSLIIQNDTEQQVVIARKLNKDESMIDYLLATGYGAQTSTLFMTSESARNILWNESLQRHQDYDFVVRYNKLFNFHVKQEPSVIYNITSSETPKIDFNSCIIFIKQNKNDISPYIYNQYNRRMLLLAKSYNASTQIIEYYKQEATCYKEYISLIEYLMVYCPQTKIEFYKYKLKYIFYLFRVKAE